MKKIIVVLLSVATIMMNCKSSTSTLLSSRVATLPLAEAAYDIGQETSAKACNYELGWFTHEGIVQPTLGDSNVELNAIEWYFAIITLSGYYHAKSAVIGYSLPNYSVEGAAYHRALKKTDGDILLDAKTTTQVDGLFFPDVCVTVSGKAATLTGPSGHTGRLKK